jgi:hypothetical protein
MQATPCFQVNTLKGTQELVEAREIHRLMMENISSIFGVDLKAIVQFRDKYLEMGGTLPITVDRVNEVFEATKQ